MHIFLSLAFGVFLYAATMRQLVIAGVALAIVVVAAGVEVWKNRTSRRQFPVMISLITLVGLARLFSGQLGYAIVLALVGAGIMFFVLRMKAERR